MMNTVVDVRHLSFAYGRKPLLQDICFQVSEGEFFIIIGPNGSGKTTLLKLLADLVKRSGGVIDFLGRDLDSYKRKELARHLAYVPQAVPTEFPFRVIELVLMGRSPYLGMLGIEGRNDLDAANQALAFTDAGHLAQHKFSHLSGGERQRVFIARAICQQPRVILLDEPTASLDLAHQVRIMDLMNRLKEEKGITIIMVSHDLNLAAMYGDRLMLLKDGAIMRLGTPFAVLQAPVLEQAYGCSLAVDQNPDGPFTRVMPVPGRITDRRPEND